MEGNLDSQYSGGYFKPPRLNDNYTYTLNKVTNKNRFCWSVGMNKNVLGVGIPPYCSLGRWETSKIVSKIYVCCTCNLQNLLTDIVIRCAYWRSSSILEECICHMEITVIQILTPTTHYVGEAAEISVEVILY